MSLPRAGRLSEPGDALEGILPASDLHGFVGVRGSAGSESLGLLRTSRAHTLTDCLMKVRHYI